MKFSCTQENILYGLNIVSRVASRAGNLPILSNIHIKAEEGSIVFKATNLEIGVSATVRGKVEQAGEFTVPAKLFTDYVASLPKERVDIILEEQTLKVKCGKHQTKIKGMPAADFPLLPTVEQGQELRVALPNFLEGLDQVLFTVSPTETRPEISGALLSADNKTLMIVGTDSYRLAEKALPIERAPGQELRAIVPLRALQELARICMLAKEEGGTAKILISQNQFAVSLPSIEFISRLIEGQYPDYRAIIPARFGTKATISRAEFAGALKTAGLFSKAGVYDVAVSFDAEKGQLGIDSLNSQTGEYGSTLQADVQGAGAKIAFNWKYLLDGVQALPGEKIVIKATDAGSPTMITEEKDSGYLYIVMPIKE